MKILANVIIVLILVEGCSNESQYEKESPIGHSWILTEIAVNGGELVSIPRYANFFWSFKEKPYNFDDTSTNAYIEGDHWCNWFYVFINIAEAGITFSPFTLFTPMSCSYLEEDGVLLNIVETKILSLHTNGNVEYEIIDDFMSLYTEDGTTLVFQRVRSE